jgi:uncharacterized protein
MAELATPHELAEHTHRPYPLPVRPWTMFQRWHDLLFAHWPVPASTLLPLLPAGLELDTFAGQAWLGVVPFRMSRVHLRGTPVVPWLSAFPEVNVRTYVRRGEHAGVWFFSLDATSWPAVLAARAWFHLPYYRASIECVERAGEIHYLAGRARLHRRPASLLAHYAPVGPVTPAQAGTLEHFLTERYCLFAAASDGGLLRGDIHHAPWPLQSAAARIEILTLHRAAGLELPPTAPLLHFARRLDVHLWAPRALEGG